MCWQPHKKALSKCDGDEFGEREGEGQEYDILLYGSKCGIATLMFT